MTHQTKQERADYYRSWWNSELGKKYRELTREKRNQQHKKYRQSKKGKIVGVRKAKRMMEKYPEKWLARRKVRYARQVGKLVKLPCEVCGDEKSFAHHEDYSKPLEVKWLCSKHHREVHGNRS